MENLKKYGKNILTAIGALGLLAGLFWTILQIYDRLIQSQADLKYELSCNTILDGDTIQNFDGKTTKYFIQKKAWNTYSDKYDELENINQLQYCHLKFINTGNKELKIKDFYSSDKFSIKFGKYLQVAAVFIKNKQTPKYVNFKITKMNNNQIDFSFDVIEPKDSVSLGILIDGVRKSFLDDDIIISGRTQFFEKIKPLNKSSAELLGDTEEFFPFRIFGIKTEIIFFIFVFILFIPLTYYTIKYDENIKKLEIAASTEIKRKKRNRRKNKKFKKEGG